MAASHQIKPLTDAERGRHLGDCFEAQSMFMDVMPWAHATHFLPWISRSDGFEVAWAQHPLSYEFVKVGPGGKIYGYGRPSGRWEPSGESPAELCRRVLPRVEDWLWLGGYSGSRPLPRGTVFSALGRAVSDFPLPPEDVEPLPSEDLAG